jgi:adenosylcobinamide-GDP ribazoletransferase
MRGLGRLFLVSVQFLTRLPLGHKGDLPPDALGRAAVFFPLVGLGLGAGGAALNYLLSPHSSRSVVTVFVLIYLVAVTGGLHEDALADAADGFGGGWKKEQILAIMRDSRIGSFGAIAVVLGLLARFACLGSLSLLDFDRFFVAGQVLNRWTALPLGFFLHSARDGGGQGALVARRITRGALGIGTALAAVIVAFVLGVKAVWAILAAITVTTATGLYYHSRLGGVTGDCMGATNQITEVAVYFAGVLLR